MIPRTFPSSVASLNGATQMIVYFLPSVTGLTRWVDYIPVQYSTVNTSTTENTYNQDGYIPVTSLSSITGMTPFKEYVPVYIDTAATDVWKVNITGFIPVGTAGIGGSALSLNFAGMSTLDPRITFSRTSNATLTGSNGLIQYAPHNLLTYSEQFDNAVWFPYNATRTANVTSSPNGTTTANQITPTGGGGHGVVYYSVLTTGEKSFSVYAKAAGYNFIALGNESEGHYAVFNLSSGTVASTSGATLSNARIQSVGNGWYRVSCVVNTAATKSASILALQSAGSISYTADGTSGIYVWGAQLSVGPLALAYTPTTSAAVYGPRFDYDPVSLAPKGLLIEEQRTNLLTYSEQFDNAVWFPYNATRTANVTSSPNGTTTANQITPTGGGGHGVIYYSVLTTGEKSFSVYAKAAGYNFIALGNESEGHYAVFDLSSGTVASTSGATLSNARIQSVGNGWYRVSCVVNTAATKSASILALQSAGSISYTADGTSGIYVWGAQLEAGAFATSYIPTVASQVTRSADVASVNTLSPWVNTSAGSLYFEGDVLALNQSGNPGMVSLDDTTTTNRVLMFQSGTGVDCRIVLGGSLASPSNSTSVTANRAYKATLAYAIGTDQGALVVNGIVGALSSPSGTFVPTRLAIGTGVSLGYLNGHIRRIAYYPRRLTNAELQALTA